MKTKQVAVIGGGAAGSFAAISEKQNHPSHQVILFEKTGLVEGKFYTNQIAETIIQISKKSETKIPTD